MKKFIEGLREFFKKNWINISFVVVALFLILAIVSVRNIQFKRHPNKALEKIILYEKFRGREGFREGQEKKEEKEKKGALEAPAGSPDVAAASDPKFCKRTDFALESACMKLDQDDCKTTDCCIWAKPRDNKAGCMAGDANGATVDSTTKTLEGWWYKGPGKDVAIKYPRESTDFKPKKQEAIKKREAMTDTQAEVDATEQEEEEHNNAIDTIEQGVAADQNKERAQRELLQKQEVENLRQKQQHINQQAALRDAQKAATVAADADATTLTALKTVAALKKQQLDEDKLNKAKLDQAINRTLSKKANEGAEISATDEATLAKSQIDIEQKERSLRRLAQSSSFKAQGEKVGGEKIDTNNAKKLGTEMTPDSTGSMQDKASLLLGIQDLMKKSALTGDKIGKVSTNSFGLAGNPLGDTASKIAGKVQAGFTNYFR